MLIKYQISTKVSPTTAQTVTVSGGTNTRYKSILLPINTDFYPVDYSEDIQDIVLAERKKAINPIVDLETIKYKFYSSDDNGATEKLLLNFRFWNGTTNNYSTEYTTVGFTTTEVTKNRNNFKKSFFRLYFYDSNSGDTNNLLFIEDINCYNTTKSELYLDRLYWLRNDPYFTDTNFNRTVYMKASFFNAKTGKVINFINPSPILATPLTIQQYSDPNNRDWRSSAINILNPKTNNGLYLFKPVTPFGANQSRTITLSEFVLT